MIIDKDAIADKLLMLRKDSSKHLFKKMDLKGKVPRKKRKKNLFASSNPNSIVSGYFRVIRTVLFNLAKKKRVKTILITSSVPFEGKSFIAANLAVSVAQGLDQYVLLVDADLRKPSLAEIFSIKRGEGLSDFLTNDRHELSSLIQKTEIPKLSFLPAGSAYEKSSELLSSELMKAFVQEVKYRYDDRYVFFDSPPAIVSETLALADAVDGIILVVWAEKTDRKVVERTVELLGRKKTLGVILNYSTEQNRTEIYKHILQYYK